MKVVARIIDFNDEGLNVVWKSMNQLEHHKRWWKLLLHKLDISWLFTKLDTLQKKAKLKNLCAVFIFANSRNKYKTTEVKKEAKNGRNKQMCNANVSGWANAKLYVQVNVVLRAIDTANRS